MQHYLHINKLNLSFGKQSPLFSDLSCQFPAQQWISILGKSGIGKSCLLRAIAGLYDQSNVKVTGQITYQQRPIQSEKISYLSQQSSLLPWLSVIDNMVISYRLRGTFTEQLYEKAEKILMQIGLFNDKHKRPAHLSGGMKQRVELARLLIDDALIILLDEPFSALDQITRFAMQTLSYELLKGKTVLLVTHDPLEALRLSDQLLILSGTPASLSSPIHFDNRPLRHIDDPKLLQQQAQLLNALSRESNVV